MSRWPTEKHFASWLGLCPHHKVSGGKVLSRKVRPSANRAATALRLAAHCLHHSHSALGAFFRRLKARLGAPKAITATAHKLARLVYRLLKYGEDYVAQGMAEYEQAYREWREYERTSTTVLNAYIQPIVERYLHAFDRHLLERGFTGTLLIMQSTRGTAERRRRPWSSVLHAGRESADHHRCESPRRSHESRQFSRWRDAPRPLSGRDSRAESGRTAART